MSCQAAVQLTVPKTATAPRQVPLKSLALEPVVQEATAHYGKPLRGSPSPLGATYIKEAVSSSSTAANAAAIGLMTSTNGVREAATAAHLPALLQQSPDGANLSFVLWI